MTRFVQRVVAVRRSGDSGSALAIALMFLMLFGLYVGSVLQFSVTGQRTTISVRSEAVDTYSGGGALDGAINAVRTSLTTGVESAGATTCFTLPAGALDNTTPVNVSCNPRTGSGAPAAGSSANQPDQAVLALSSTTGEGVALGAASTLSTQGAVLAAGTVTVPTGSTLISTGAVKGGTCAVKGTSTPACTTGSVPPDPDWAAPTTYPTLAGTLPACAVPVIRLNPGTYQSAAAFQAVLNCPNTVVWLRPGLYNLDFSNNGTHELAVGAGTTLVGGTPKGWTPGTTSPGAVPKPTAGAPNASACDTSATGVELVFGGDSRLTASSGQVQLCARSTSTSAQHLVARGLSAEVSVPGTAASTTATSSDLLAAGADRWSKPANGAAVDGKPASVRIKKSRDPDSKLLVGPASATLVPSDATGISVTATVAETVYGSGVTWLIARPGDGSAATAPVRLKDCATGPTCNSRGLIPGDTDAATFTGLTPAKANGMSFELVVQNPDKRQVRVWVDGITVDVTFSAPLRPTCVLTSPSGACGTGNLATPVIYAVGSSAVVALHGTVHIPEGVVSLALLNVPNTVIDRGVVARHLASAMTRAAAFAGPLISIPALGERPRRVLLQAVNGSGQVLARADVTFADTAGTANGPIPTVLEWSVR